MLRTLTILATSLVLIQTAQAAPVITGVNANIYADLFTSDAANTAATHNPIVTGAAVRLTTRSIANPIRGFTITTNGTQPIESVRHSFTRIDCRACYENTTDGVTQQVIQISNIPVVDQNTIERNFTPVNAPLISISSAWVNANAVNLNQVVTINNLSATTTASAINDANLGNLAPAAGGDNNQSSSSVTCANAQLSNPLGKGEGCLVPASNI